MECIAKFHYLNLRQSVYFNFAKIYFNNRFLIAAHSTFVNVWTGLNFSWSAKPRCVCCGVTLEMETVDCSNNGRSTTATEFSKLARLFVHDSFVAADATLIYVGSIIGLSEAEQIGPITRFHRFSISRLADSEISTSESRSKLISRVSYDVYFLPFNLFIRRSRGKFSFIPFDHPVLPPFHWRNLPFLS